MTPWDPARHGVKTLQPASTACATMRR
jgi:hypothetical protein